MRTRTFAITTAVCLAVSAILLTIAAVADLPIVGIVGALVLVGFALAYWWWWTS